MTQDEAEISEAPYQENGKKVFDSSLLFFILNLSNILNVEFRVIELKAWFCGF